MASTQNHVAIYGRVSTKRQDTASQVPDLNRWFKAQPTPDSRRIYLDKFTGKSMDRPAWNKLWAAVERGEITTIVIWRLDRLGRTASGLTKLFDELRAKNVNLISVKDAL